MKILSLEVENFMAIGKIDARLDERGLVLIEGENKDDSSQNSNGSGKSSFPDALSWCLFGVTARGDTGDKVINRTAKRGTRVAVKLMDGEQRYQVARHRKHSGNKNRLVVLKWDNAGETWRDITGGTDKLTQVTVDRLVGCSPQVFNAAIYAGQEAMPDLPGMTDKALKLLVEEAAGVNRLQDAHEKARARAREAESAMAEGRQQRELIRSHIAVCESDTAEAKEAKGEFENKRKLKMAEIKKSYVEATKGYKQSKEALDAFVPVDHSERLEELDVILDSATALRNAAEDCQATLQEREREQYAAQTNLDRLKADLAKLKDDYAKINDRVGSPCDSCGKPYEEHDLDEVPRLAKARYDDALSKTKAALGKLSNVNKLVVVAQKALSEAKAALPDMTEVNREHNALTEADYKSARTLSGLEEEVRRATQDATLIKDRFDDIKGRENPYGAQIERLKKRRTELDKALTDLGVKLEDAEADLAVKQATVRLFGPAGVRAHILDTVTPFLNARTSHYLTILSDGNIHAVWSTLTKKADGDMSEKFQIAVSSATGADSFGGLSGGEKRKVRLACAMALQDLVASRASKPIELFIADEIDQALDESGLERLMAILEDKASERGTVLAISHHSLGDWIRQSVTIVKSGGKSTMIGTALAMEAPAYA